MGDLISREFSVKALREYAEQKHTVGQTELANGILKAINFLQKEENVPTAYDVEKVAAEIEQIYGTNIVGIYGRITKYPYIPKDRVLQVVRNGGKE